MSGVITQQGGRDMRKLVHLLAVLSLVTVLLALSVGVAFANPADAPGAGDPTDTANVATGQNPNIALVGTPAEEKSAADILAINVLHVPVCGGHASTH